MNMGWGCGVGCISSMCQVNSLCFRYVHYSVHSLKAVVV